MQDGIGRKIEYLRVSVTDRCNLRCRYCMPQEGIEQFAHADCLTLEEIYRIVSVMADMGLKKVRFTGGEPMVRKNLVKLVRDVAGLSQIRDVAMTTNGVLFADQVEEFARAGLTAVNISLDTLEAEQFAQITGRDGLEKVLDAVNHSLEQGLKVRINCVPVRELNGGGDGQAGASYMEVAELARKYPVDVRFIELMPIGCGREFHGISGRETLAALESCYGHATETVRRGGLITGTGVESSGTDVGSGKTGEAYDAAVVGNGENTENADERNGPARYVKFAGFQGRIGFIDPLSHQFCAECNRLRLTVDGKLKLCLYYADGVDLKRPIRGGASDEELRTVIEQALQKKPKAHQFGQDGAQADGAQEERRMVQIGG